MLSPEPLTGTVLVPRPACSLHLAFSSIRLGQCPSAINAGVNLLITPNTTAMTQKAGMLAVDGRCKTLSSDADGYSRADTCGVMLLHAGVETGALAVVAGTAVNQDGRSSSLTAPNGPSQQEVIRTALSVARLPAGQVTALQMHGTGALGAACSAAPARLAEQPPALDAAPTPARPTCLQARLWETPSKWALLGLSWLRGAHHCSP